MPSDRRLHPLSILFNLAGAVRGFALPGIVVLVTAGSVGAAWQVWMLPLAIPYAIVAVGRYFTFRYRYEANEMVIRTGFLFRNERHVPYARIQNLDAVQNVFHRLLDVVEVRVETGGGDEPEARMSVLPVAAFEEMRRRVFEGKGGVAEPAAAAETGAPGAGRTLLHLPVRELLLCGLVQNRGVLILGAAFGLLWELDMMDRFDGGSGGPVPGRDGVRAFLKGLLGLDWLPGVDSLLGGLALTLAGIAVLVLLFRLLSMGWAVVRLHGFRLTLAGEDLRTEFGLLTRVVATIPLRRIQTLTVHEGPLHRLLGRVSVRVETAGAGGGDEDDEGAKTQREWLAPILRREELPRLVREVLPGMDLASASWQAAPPRAFRRELKGWLIVLALPLPPLLLWKGWALCLVPLLVAWAWLGARGTVANLGWAVTDGALFFRSGWIWRRVSVAPFVKIQAVEVHESPFDRRAGMARVKVDTAGAKEGAGVDIPYLPRDTAAGLGGLLAAQAARTAFRW